ncbi:UNVERIFIED_CONTAM: hypothetical protein GTU68_018241 [Idotea baltica]|nr:hypothetical protein [Idotea baltica]
MCIIIRLFFVSGIIVLPIVFLSFFWIEYTTDGRTYNDLGNVPINKVGLVLGTSKTLSNGRQNLYFTYRVNAAAELYQSGKVKCLLVSGDNSRATYDEPNDFKTALMSKGVPADHIYLDYAGFRTLDSVARSKAVFGQDKMTIISQEFHNKRAIYLADHFGIDAIAFNATGISTRYGWKVLAREYLARTKAILDTLFKVKPKFLGEKIVIE